MSGLPGALSRSARVLALWGGLGNPDADHGEGMAAPPGGAALNRSWRFRPRDRARLARTTTAADAQWRVSAAAQRVARKKWNLRPVGNFRIGASAIVDSLTASARK